MTSLDKLKLTAVTWDGDREPEKYSAWDYAIGSMTRAIEDGPPLEDWLDAKIGRAKMGITMPSIFDDDPELAGAQPVGYQSMGSAGETTTSSADTSQSISLGAVSQHSQHTLAQSGVNYMDLPEASRKLDALLYNDILMNVKGTKSALLRCVKFPSYVLARIVLHRHMDISRNDRKSKAIARVDNVV